MELSIVIPVYKSQNILPKLVLELQKNINFVKDWELVLVNDSSPDESWEVIKELSCEYKFIKGINLRKNAGQHNAIMAGLNYANGEVIVMMDDDLQHSPTYIKNLYDEIKKGFDVCYTNFENKQHQNWKILGSKFNDLVANILLKKPKNLYLSSFKSISKDIKDEIIKYDGPYPYVDGLIVLTTNNISTIKIKHYARIDGEGNYNLIKSTSLWLKMATSFSILPLRIATMMGVFISIISFILGIYFIFLKLFSNTAPTGWTSLMVVVLFLGGIQLISLGIIGEYLGRSYLKLNKKQQFVVGEILESKGSK